MAKLVLSTSNIMGAGSSVIRRPTSSAQKSNTELTYSLRANLSAAQQAISQEPHNNGLSPTSHPSRPPHTTWTTRTGSTIYIPSINFTDSGLAEERSQYEITVKLFFLPNKSTFDHCVQAKEAIELVLQVLQIPSIDLLIISYPGITFDAEDENDESSTQTTNPGVDALHANADAEDIDNLISTWHCLEAFHDEGVIKKLGVSEFGTQRLSKFLRKARIRPSVDQINVRDCCVVPKALIVYAKKERIELLTHNDYTNILPPGTVRELLGQGAGGAGVLADGGEGELKGEVEPQWVIKYTAVVKDRGVIENKGYFAVAELRES